MTIRKMADEAKIDWYTSKLPANRKARLNAATDEMLASIAAEEENSAYAYARIAARAARRGRA